MAIYIHEIADMNPCVYDRFDDDDDDDNQHYHR